MQKKHQHIAIITGLSVAVIGTAAFFLMRKKSKSGTQANVTSNNGGMYPTAFQYPANVAKDAITTLLNMVNAPKAGTTSKSNPAKTLQPGLSNDQDVKLLQQYLNKITTGRHVSKTDPIVAVLSLNGNFNPQTAEAMNVYLGKQDMTIQELNQRIAGSLAASTVIIN